MYLLEITNLVYFPYQESVPQGSVPYHIYINDLPSVIKCKSILFAPTLIRIDHTNSIRNDLDMAKLCLILEYLKPNDSKTENYKSITAFVKQSFNYFHTI